MWCLFLFYFKSWLNYDTGFLVGHFLEVCRRRDLKINADKGKVVVLGEEEGLEREIRVDGA